MKHRLSLIGLLFGAMTLLLMNQAWADSSTPATTKHLDGKPGAISDYAGKGKWLVVMLWASDCPVCNREAPNYEAFNEKHKNKDAQVIGVSLDGQANVKDAKEFVKRHGVKFPNLVGEPQNVARMYKDLTGEDWVGTPTFMVYNPKGELLGSQVGGVPVKVIEDFIRRESKS